MVTTASSPFAGWPHLPRVLNVTGWRGAHSLVGKRIRVTSVIVLLALAAGSLTAFAVASSGYPGRKVDLNDAGIWVTNNLQGVFGRLNKSAAALDAVFNPPGGAQATYQLDVLQDASSVLARDESGGKVVPVDVRSGTPIVDQAKAIGADAVVDLRGGTLAVLDRASGKIWATRYDAAAPIIGLDGLGLDAKPLAMLSPQPAGRAPSSALVVGADGVVHALDATGHSVTISPSGSRLAPPVRGTASSWAQVSLTAVGSHVVALDPTAGKVAVDGGPVIALPPGVEGAVLQQPSGDADSVLLGSRAGLISIRLDGSGAVSSLYSAPLGSPAQPIRVAGCAYEVWAGTSATLVSVCPGGTATRIPLDRQGALVKPVFRVNRASFVLNDEADGRVFDLDLRRSVDQWKQVQPPQQPQHNQNPTTQATRDRKKKPTATDDKLGARPGRTTVLHVLDNDTDPSGRILSISSVTQPNNGASVSPSPDGQTLLYHLPSGAPSGSFSYTIDNGTEGGTDSGRVTVESRLPGQNAPPALRPLGSRAPSYSVASGARVSMPLLTDWRDYDGDPVSLADVSAKAGVALAAADGTVSYTSPPQSPGGPQQVDYTVTDGIAPKPTAASVTVSVLAASATTGVQARTEPDVASGDAGSSIIVSPLQNDLPGADPTNTSTQMALASPVASPPGTTVTTDLATGQLAVTAKAPGPYFLSYNVAFGAAPLATGQIRVNVVPRPTSPRPPIAMPDQATVHGATPTTVDAVANDVDPAGGMLTVLSATAEQPQQLSVAVVKGRWLRIVPTTATLHPTPQVVHYTLTNGVGSPVTGDVSVSQLPVVSPDPPVVQQDSATVRAGDSVLVPVLDNDSTVGGSALSLLPDVEGAPAAGMLPVLDPAQPTSKDVGTAYVVGKQVRYVAPAAAAQSRTILVTYVAQTDAGERATGQVQVTVLPPPSATRPDQAPTPHPLEARVVAGDTVVVPIPSSGTDPDGDSTTVVGVGSASQLGRVTGYSPTSLTYQAYPTSSGTDSVDYVVTDRFGLSATSTIRIAVTEPGAPQLPISVPDTVTAAPGATVTIDPMENDLTSADDDVNIRPLAQTNAALPAGARLESATGPLRMIAPGAGERPAVLSYGLSGNAGNGPLTTVTVRSQDGINLPPRVFSESAQPTGAPTVTTDVLKRAYDPDGDTTALRISQVADPAATVTGGAITVAVADHAQAIPFQVTDSGGAVSSAVLYVPAVGADLPYAVPGKSITVDQGKSATVSLADYVVSPKRKPLSLTTQDRLWAAPAGMVTLTSPAKGRLQVTAHGSYVGPAAITFEVTDGTSLTDPKAHTVLVTVPVQVGPVTPVLHCPTDVIAVVEGGAPWTFDPGSLCHVWMPDPSQVAALTYTTTWTKSAGDVRVEGSPGRRLSVVAGSSAKPGATAGFSLTATGTRATPATMTVRVVAAPPPTISPITLQEVKQGQSAQVDVHSYMTSPLATPSYTVVSARHTSGMPGTITSNGSVLSVTPGPTSHGPMSFLVTASDVGDKTRSDRQVTTTLSLSVFGVPDAPSAPQGQTALLSHSAVLSWRTGAANGAPIDSFEVRGSGASRTCQASPCTITGLPNGSPITFMVRAHNKAGWSAWSPSSGGVTPNAKPQAVTGLTASDPQDHSMQLRWNAAVVDGSPVTKYVVTWVGGSTTTAATSVRASGLDNNAPNTFAVVPYNAAGAGPAAATKGQSSGVPLAPTGITVAGIATADGSAAAVRVSWGAVVANGPGPTTYGVRRNDGKVICSGVTATSCTDDGVAYDGTTYTYVVSAANATPGHAGPPATSGAYQSIGNPASWGGWAASATGVDRQVHVTATVPPSRGASATVTLLDGTAVVNTWAVSPGGGPLDQMASFENGTTHTLTLKVCNEKDRCGSTATSQTVTPFGPIPTPGVSLSKDGPTTFQVHVDANGNGRVITVHVTTDSGHAWDKTTTGPAHWDLGGYGVGYNQRDQAHVTIIDSAKRPVPGQVDSNAQTADPPPPPPATVTVYHGRVETTVVTCPPTCLHVGVTTANFTSNVSCTVTSTAGGGFVGFTQGANQTKDSPNVVQSGYRFSVTVTCTDGQGHSANGTFNNW